MPRRLIWVVTWLMLIAMAVTPVFYVTAMSNDPVVEGSMSPDADSWGIPMFSAIFVVLFIVGPVALGVTSAATNRYTRPNLLVWRRDRLRRSVTTTIVAVVALGGILAIAIQDFLSSPPPYEAEWLPMLVLVVLWVAMLRASIVSMGERPLASDGATS